MTAETAMRTIAEASRYEGALRQRTEGLTTILWAIVSPAIFLSYALAGSAFGDGDWPLWAYFLWAPWVAMGAVATVALWKTAALSAPVIEKDGPRAATLAIGWGAFVVAIFGTLGTIDDANPPLVVLVLLGAAWTLFGLLNVHRCSARGRRIEIGIGVATLAAALGALFFVPTRTDPAYLEYVWGTAIAVVAAGGFPFAGGVYQVLRS
ncbi:MAG: hypothetical protein ACT4PT_12745 [Methanobacteriota archaeon]